MNFCCAPDKCSTIKAIPKKETQAYEINQLPPKNQEQTQSQHKTSN